MSKPKTVCVKHEQAYEDECPYCEKPWAVVDFKSEPGVILQPLPLLSIGPGFSTSMTGVVCGKHLASHYADCVLLAGHSGPCSPHRNIIYGAP